MSENIIDLEKKIIYLLLHDKSLVESFIDSNLKIEYFNKDYHLILNSIISAFEKDVLLTRSFFETIIKRISQPLERVKQERIFASCYTFHTDRNEFPHLIEKIFDSFLVKVTSDNIRKFEEKRYKIGTHKALQEMIQNIQDLVTDSSVSTSNIRYEDVEVYSKEYRKYCEDLFSGKIKEEEIVLCGIKEIDETLITGFAPGTLSLFCGDVGSFKSTVMLNIALNVWKKGYNVLFVPLEMPSDQIYKRSLSREARISSFKLFRPLTQTDEDKKKIEEAEKLWHSEDKKGLFYIADMPERTTVNVIRRQIEKHVNEFHPQLVVIDYIANLNSDISRYGRNDLEIGDILKELRAMGRIFKFGVVSAAQIGREALKRIRRSTKDRMINSEDIRGSHEYSADADYIGALVPNSSQPNALIDYYVVKSRNGKKTFENNAVKATFDVIPEICLVKSQSDYTEIGNENIEQMYEDKEQNSSEYENPVINPESTETIDW